MKPRTISVGLGLCLALLLTVAPAAAQMWFFPDFSLPSPGDTPATWVAGTWGRGLNDDSGKLDAFGAAVGRTTERASFMGAFGYINDVEEEYTAGGAVSIELMTRDALRFSIQGGIGWMDFDVLGETVTALRFPIGVALKGNVGSGSTSVTPWVMPRINISRLSGLGDSETETDFGASGGVSVTSASGFGFHAALDALFANETLWQLGVGLHYRLGQ